MTACGQTSTHFPHWMHRASSHAGISSAIPRFSHRAVPVGYVPSAGSALTGSASPSPAIIRAVTRRTKSGAPARTGGHWFPSPVTVPGTATSLRCSSAASTASQFLCTTVAPRRPYVFSMAFLIAAMASSRGNTPLIAKKQACITVLTRPPIPASCATRLPSMANIRRRLSMICRWTGRGR